MFACTLSCRWAPFLASLLAVKSLQQKSKIHLFDYVYLMTPQVWMHILRFMHGEKKSFCAALSFFDSTSPPIGLTFTPSATSCLPAVQHTAYCIVQATNSSQQLLLLISNHWQNAIGGSGSVRCLYPCATVGEQQESSAIFVPVCHLFNTPDWLSHHSLLINMQWPLAPPLLAMP